MIDAKKIVPLCFYFQSLEALHYQMIGPGMKKENEEEFVPLDEIFSANYEDPKAIKRVAPMVDVWMLGQSFKRIFKKLSTSTSIDDAHLISQMTWQNTNQRISIQNVVL